MDTTDFTVSAAGYNTAEQYTEMGWKRLGRNPQEVVYHGIHEVTLKIEQRCFSKVILVSNVTSNI